MSKLIPSALPDVDGARPTQENIVVAQCRLRQLDHPRNNVRIRLNTTVVRRQAGARQAGASLAKVDYVHDRRDGAAERVRATHVIMACWNRVTARW